MKKKTYSLLTAFVLAAMGCWVMFTLKPLSVRDKVPLSEFSAKRAMQHVESISKKPHYVGSPAHSEVATYLMEQLRELGLQPRLQEGFAMKDPDKLTYAKNIIARIPGSGGGKALILLSHYDSAPHTKSFGASDDASGVAAILEGIRAFLHAKTAHKNDIIILFTDAEELGLNGAALFVDRHPLAKKAGLVLNFEARGSGGASCMLMEVNNGNAAMVEGFSEAGTEYPVSNSLMYSIYKMLPNDTDLTVFRENGKIQGFNFAFIDDHFDYHTAQDDAAHLDVTTLAHQGTYLMPLLAHFGNADLSKLDAGDDDNYFNTPVGFLHYPFSWNVPLLIFSFLLFSVLIFLGLGKRVFIPSELFKGFVPLLTVLLLSGLLAYGGWALLKILYPSYNEIQQGFTYNGYWYIAAFSALTLAICFFTFKKGSARNKTMNHFVAPLFLWLLLNAVICIALPGAGFFIFPGIAGLVMLGYYVVTQKISRVLNWFLALPCIVILLPFVKMLPVGLGLKMLFAGMLFVVFIFTLLLPLFGQFPKKNVWGAGLLLLSIVFFAKAHFDSGYEKGKALPDSLVYYLNADTGNAYWASYDATADDWNAPYLGAHPQKADVLNYLSLSSKYNRPFRMMAPADVKALPAPSIEFIKDSVAGGRRSFHIRITPVRNVNRYDLFLTKKVALYGLKANGIPIPKSDGSSMGGKKDEKLLLSYYVTGQRPLNLEFTIDGTALPQLELTESSFDLLENALFDVKPRPAGLMPKSFIINDAVIVRKKVTRTSAAILPQPERATKVGDTIEAENPNG